MVKVIWDWSIELQKETPGGLDQSLQQEIQNIPHKLSFKISEVSDLLGIKPHVLRYWEMEFSSLHPKKMSNGQRLYFKKDVAMALLIKKLLYRDKFSVRGAKKVLSELKKESRTHQKQSTKQTKVLKDLESMREIIADLRELIK